MGRRKALGVGRLEIPRDPGARLRDPLQGLKSAPGLCLLGLFGLTGMHELGAQKRAKPSGKFRV